MLAIIMAIPMLLGRPPRLATSLLTPSAPIPPTLAFLSQSKFGIRYPSL